uniref:ATP synthase subunit a n=1 Tax=Neolepetopsis sp. TaxID=3071115 RepID=A0AA96KJM3_9GAST|nr:ATP synthase F0 subunit 6 [Neolepetopsis sp.]
MLVDIFSTFDDHNFVFMNYYILMWVLVLFCGSFLFCMKWVSSSLSMELFNVLKLVVFTQSSRSFGSKLGGFSLVLSSFFIVLFVFNMSGLVPYVFSVSAHLSFSLSFGFCFWASLIISSFSYNFLVSLSHLLPVGAPSFLNPFLVLVETASIFFRPLTISIRLVANISAGHIVLGLVGSFLCEAIISGSLISLVVICMLEMGYFTFEFGVAMIQSYIFCLLVSLYSEEHAF